MTIRLLATMAALAALPILADAAPAQQPPASAAAQDDEAGIADLITASHVLANEGIMDSFGHGSVRSIKNPRHFFMPRAMPPALIQRKDIFEISIDDCELADHGTAKLNGERYIHCEIYKARPDVKAVNHNHDEAVLPFAISDTPLQPVIHTTGFLPERTPVFDIRDVPLANKGMLVSSVPLGDALARALGNNPAVLMRGHGEAVVGASVKEVLIRTIYIDENAKVQASAAALGRKLIVLNADERAAYDREERPERPWENFTQRLPGGAKPR